MIINVQNVVQAKWTYKHLHSLDIWELKLLKLKSISSFIYKRVQNYSYAVHRFKGIESYNDKSKIDWKTFEFEIEKIEQTVPSTQKRILIYFRIKAESMIYARSQWCGIYIYLSSVILLFFNGFLLLAVIRGRS